MDQLIASAEQQMRGRAARSRSAPTRIKLGGLAVDLSELGDFLHLPIRTYSTGMRARLSFAVSTSIAPEILLLDEGVASADAKFMHKASARMEQLVQRTGTLVFATHERDQRSRSFGTEEPFLLPQTHNGDWSGHSKLVGKGVLTSVRVAR